MRFGGIEATPLPCPQRCRVGVRPDLSPPGADSSPAINPRLAPCAVFSRRFAA